MPLLLARQPRTPQIDLAGLVGRTMQFIANEKGAQQAIATNAQRNLIEQTKQSATQARFLANLAQQKFDQDVRLAQLKATQDQFAATNQLNLSREDRLGKQFEFDVTRQQSVDERANKALELQGEGLNLRKSDFEIRREKAEQDREMQKAQFEALKSIAGGGGQTRGGSQSSSDLPGGPVEDVIPDELLIPSPNGDPELRPDPSAGFAGDPEGLPPDSGIETVPQPAPAPQRTPTEVLKQTEERLDAVTGRLATLQSLGSGGLAGTITAEEKGKLIAEREKLAREAIDIRRKMRADGEGALTSTQRIKLRNDISGFVGFQRTIPSGIQAFLDNENHRDENGNWVTNFGPGEVPTTMEAVSQWFIDSKKVETDDGEETKHWFNYIDKLGRKRRVPTREGNVKFIEGFAKQARAAMDASRELGLTQSAQPQAPRPAAPATSEEARKESAADFIKRNSR